LSDLTVGELLKEAAAAIGRSRSIDHWQPRQARYDAEELMLEVAGEPLDARRRRSRLSSADRRRFATFVARRIDGEPVAQIRGHFEFRGMDLVVRRGVFAPRASSELLAGEAVAALRRARQPRVAVDVATGAGPMALAMACEVPSAEVWGLDISSEAVRLCRVNARRVGAGNVRFRVSDMLSALPSRLRGGVSVITVHPPYVARSEVRILPREIRDFEPVHTLTDGSDDGLGMVRLIAAAAQEWLRPGGTLFVEIGTYLARGASTTLRRAGLADVRSQRDSLGVTRVVSGRRPRQSAAASASSRRLASRTR
jgi:release factor glutamine methyltransferase